jgi:hypothetical protein
MVLLSNNYGRSRLGVDLISHVLISISLFSDSHPGPSCGIVGSDELLV